MLMMQILIALNAAILFFFIIFLIKQFLNRNQNQVLQGLIELHLAELLETNQSKNQELKESVLMHISLMQQTIFDRLRQSQLEDNKAFSEFKEQSQQAFTLHRSRFEERQLEALKILQDTLLKGTQDNREQVKTSLQEYALELGKQITQLTQTTEGKLKEINQQVEKRLADGFEKTNETFGDVIKRLALIDAAQKQISELSNSVISLHDILNDKRSRGAFGEVQLSALINNMIPPQHYSFQHLLSNHKRPDCMLFLPEPTGNIAVDAKFPLENFRLAMDGNLSELEKQQAVKQFKVDIRKHIQDIAEKYIIPGETSDGAVMFIPAEAIFAEIHAHHVDLVEYAQKAKVWLVSPTTMMAILTTARAVLKDAATRKQVHEIQKHLRLLSDDFQRFQMRMDNLAKRIAQTHTDVEQIHISSRKITQRFIHIDRAEFDMLDKIESPALVEVESAESSVC